MDDLYFVESPADSAPSSVSKLRKRIELLNVVNRQKLHSTAEEFYRFFLRGLSDDVPFDEESFYQTTTKPALRSLEYPSKAVIAQVYDDYHNREKNVLQILQEQHLDKFDVVASLCELVRAHKTVNLSRAIECLCIGEYMVIQFVDMLTSREKFTAMDMIRELCILPSGALLILTIVWAELEFPTAAKLFEPRLSVPVTMQTEDFEETDQQFQNLLTQHFSMYNLNNDDLDRAKIDLEFTKFKNEFQSQSEETKSISAGLKKLREAILGAPELHIETIIDSSESDNEDVDDNNEADVLVFMKTRTAKWLQQELSQENIQSELSLHNFCFAPLSKLYPNDANVQKTDGFAKCTLGMFDEANQSFTVNFVVAMGSQEDADIRPVFNRKQEQVARNELKLNAVADAPSVRCPEGTRVIAHCERLAEQIGFHRTTYFPGTVAVRPSTQNRFEYLIFFDIGADFYVKPDEIRLLVDQPFDSQMRFSPRSAHTKVVLKDRAEFIRRYLSQYPDWPLIQLKKLANTQRVAAVRDKGTTESAFVLDVDRQLALLRFPTIRTTFQNVAKPTAKDCVVINCKEHQHSDEWVYRGNPDRFPTLAQAQNWDNRVPQPGSGAIYIQRQNINKRAARKINSSQFEMVVTPYGAAADKTHKNLEMALSRQQSMQTARKRNGSKRITMESIKTMQIKDRETLQKKDLSERTKDVKVPIPKWPCRLARHFIGPKRLNCTNRCVDFLRDNKNLEEEVYRIRSPYLTPLLLGWTRTTIQTVNCERVYVSKKKDGGGRKEKVVYVAPCGVRLSSIAQVAQYLRNTQQRNVTIDMFSFNIEVRPQVKATVDPKYVKSNDFTHGQEAVPIPMVNAINAKPGPEIIYRPRRTGLKRMQKAREDEPGTSSKQDTIEEESIDVQFCSGCSCTDDCMSNDMCECRRLTVQANNRLSESLRVSGVKGYNYKLLEEKMITGIYECNSLCKCNQETCFNRVVQQTIKIPLQLFMTAEKGWGVRTLVDIAPHTFVCTYAGELLDNDVADTRKNDIYLADLDLISAVEGEKEQQGIDYIADEGFDELEEEALNASDSVGTTNPEVDEAFDESPTSAQLDTAADEEFSAFDEELAHQKMQEHNSIGNRPAKQMNRRRNGCAPWKYDQFEEYFGDDIQFTIDAAKTGNIGRFLNHSCSPNCDIQHCLVDTHDLRLPWCAFFTRKFVKAGEELSWDYNYEKTGSTGQMADRNLMCRCGAPKCRGQLL